MLWKHNNKFNRKVNKAFATENNKYGKEHVSFVSETIWTFFCNLVDVATRKEGAFCALQDAFGNPG